MNQFHHINVNVYSFISIFDILNQGEFISLNIYIYKYIHLLESFLEFYLSLLIQINAY